jgi:hypothetical protein
MSYGKKSFDQLSSTLPAGTPFVLLSLRAKNCIMGSISSLLLGMPSPFFFQSLISTNSKASFSFETALSVTADALAALQIKTGVLLDTAQLLACKLYSSLQTDHASLSKPEDNDLAWLVAALAYQPFTDDFVKH